MTPPLTPGQRQPCATCGRTDDGHDRAAATLLIDTWRLWDQTTAQGRAQMQATVNRIATYLASDRTKDTP